MNLKEIKELIKIIDSSSLSELHIEQDDLKLTLKKEVVVQQINTTDFKISEYVAKERIADFYPSNIATTITGGTPTANTTIDASVLSTSATAAGTTENREVEDINVHMIKSPIVGVFYGSSTPEAPQLVKVGDRIKTGQVLCIVEAMKMMNEIVSDVDGEVVEIFGKNQDPVEFGQLLFKIRKA
jgi:acetyl-CoA carboxylase biotin carboxyl carrier protein